MAWQNLKRFLGAGLICACVLLGACASKKSKATAPTENADSGVDTAPPPASISSEDLPPAEGLSAPSTPTLKDVQVGVYIDSIGYDALSALGFMQELEKAGVKPVKVVGTGFGCWVAAAWALENSGNRAEWQSFKWTRWDTLPQQGLLNRIRGALGAEQRFFNEYDKHFKVARFSDLKLPADCPLLSADSNYTFESGANYDLRETLWWQLLHPVSGTAEGFLEDEKKLSGIFIGFPSDEEWHVLSRGLSSSQPMLWLHLKTRRATERRLGINNSVLLGLRSEPPASPLLKRTSSGDYWMQIDLSSAGGKRTPESLRDPSGRRRFLLEGRKTGRQLLDTKFIEMKFGELFAAPAGG